MPVLRLSQIAARIGAVMEGTGDPEITGVAGIREAGPGQITFLANSRYQAHAGSTGAAALIVSRDFVNPGAGAILLRTDEPYLAFLKTMELFGTVRPPRPPGIDPTAVIREGVRLGRDVSIGAQVVIEEGAVLGERVVLMPGVFVGPGAVLGDDVFIYPHVTIREGCRLGNRVAVHAGAVIGSDGFGYARDGELNRKIPQLGTVVVEDDVEIGANVTIDRATTGVTHIGSGVRIDNLVQIAHNVVIGENSILCAQVGISGSTEVGRNVVLAGQAGLVGHIRIGDGAVVGAQGGVTKSVPAGRRVSGYPAAEHERALRVEASVRRLPELIRTLKEVVARLDRLEKELDRKRESVL